MTKIPNPFEKFDHHTEWSVAIVVIGWMNEIIKELNLSIGPASGEKRGIDGKRPDILIYKSPQSNKVICVLEFKPPYFDPFDENELKEPARLKATRRNAPYFCTSNFKQLIWFNTVRVNKLEPEEKQIIEKYELSTIEDLDAIEEPRFRGSIKQNLKRFLKDLIEISSGKKPEPLLPIDEFLIYRLQQKIKVLQIHYKRVIKEEVKNPEFTKKLQKWFIEQAWTFAWQDEDYEKAARQAAYLLINKILFYNVLQSKRNDLDPLEIPESLTKGGLLQKTLQSYFDYVLQKIDYETIYSTDFIDQLAFPDNKDVVEEIKELIGILNRHNFAQLGFDIIGRIFEKLIPAEERHILGQYFTNPDVVDIILKFCLKKEDDNVLDPACGAGTFLVRAYQHKKLMNPRLSHEGILGSLWGNDIAKFPAHLTTINLAINDLSVAENYPLVIQKDFFDLLPEKVKFKLPEKWREVTLKGLGGKEKVIVHPSWFDCIVGNPPYTRQEEIAGMTGQEIGYKEELIGKALYKLGPKSIENKLAEIPKRAGIHAYFFVHGFKFLHEGGRFGFIVSNSWLDVDYGKGLQEFFLKNYKIISIIESKIERWFEDADINTCIVILEKCTTSNKERDENLVRFVQLKKPLRHFIPVAENMWEKQVKRLEEIDKLIKAILGHSNYYENEELRIFPKSQKDLWEEGLEDVREGFSLPEKESGGLKTSTTQESKYVGSKWGKYLRAPDIFFKILEKGKGKLVPLKKVAKVRRGFTTGADPWFYVSDVTESADVKEIKKIVNAKGYKGKNSNLRLVQSGDGTKWLIEKEYLYPVVRNPNYYRNVIIDIHSIKDFVIIVTKPREEIKGELVEKYILHGEKKAYKMGKNRSLIPAETETCASRKYWYQLPDIRPSRILWQKAFDIYHRHYLVGNDVLANQRFYPIYSERERNVEIIASFLNSPLVPLYLEFQRSIMGLGAIESTVEEVKQFLVIDPKVVTSSIRSRLSNALKKLGQREVGSVFEEFCASSPETVYLDKIKSDRRELDKIIMGEILGLADEEQLEVYRAIIDLVKSRIEKAKSFGKRKKTREGLDIDLLSKTILERIGENNLANFYKEKILSQQVYHRDLPKFPGEIIIQNTLMGWLLTSGKESIECLNETQARYLKVWLEAGLEKVVVPVEIEYLDTIIDELESIMNRTKQTINEHLSSIFDRKTRKQILYKVWQEITKF